MTVYQHHLGVHYSAQPLTHRGMSNFYVVESGQLIQSLRIGLHKFRVDQQLNLHSPPGGLLQGLEYRTSGFAFFVNNVEGLPQDLAPGTIDELKPNLLSVPYIRLVEIRSRRIGFDQFDRRVCGTDAYQHERQ